MGNDRCPSRTQTATPFSSSLLLTCSWPYKFNRKLIYTTSCTYAHLWSSRDSLPEPGKYKAWRTTEKCRLATVPSGTRRRAFILHSLLPGIPKPWMYDEIDVATCKFLMWIPTCMERPDTHFTKNQPWAGYECVWDPLISCHVLSYSRKYDETWRHVL